MCGQNNFSSGRRRVNFAILLKVAAQLTELMPAIH